MFRSFVRRNGNGRKRNLSVRAANISLSATLKRMGLVAAVAASTTAFAWSVYGSGKAQDQPTSPLNPKEFIEFPLLWKKEITHNTAIYRFKLPSPDQTLALPVASFILVSAEIPGEEKPVIRPYTPVTYDEKGYFDLLVKSYPAGKVSKKFAELKIGDNIKVKGPNVKLEYKPNMKKSIGMIAGGTGITPMLQILHAILENPDDKTEVTLIFGNQTSNDILVKSDLDLLQQTHRNFKVHYIIDKPEEGWKGNVGYVTDEFAKKLLPPPSNDSLIFVCGPPPMMESISGGKTPKYEQGELKGVLKRLGYTEENVFKF